MFRVKHTVTPLVSYLFVVNPVESSARILEQTTAASTGNEIEDIANSMVTEPSEGHADYSRNSIRMKESTDRKPIKAPKSLPSAVPAHEIRIQQRPSFSAVAEETARVKPEPSTTAAARILSITDQVCALL
ncbi:hypothetical protein OESDEN_00837 [Oesophagostomum dentatum]|uniref:Uncharacterized protein n=1 Tax=Oesophagostomum dentatum TaxID=61180 RepID=A0A0B1TUT7_OESDE|nr:hypothetical protein OESDEN_00837 [Oesophagostomum dentatum]